MRAAFFGEDVACNVSTPSSFAGHRCLLSPDKATIVSPAGL
jgi:hypothetical protein